MAMKAFSSTVLRHHRVGVRTGDELTVVGTHKSLMSNRGSG
jgi:hypothetical protein